MSRLKDDDDVDDSLWRQLPSLPRLSRHYGRLSRHAVDGDDEEEAA